MNPPPAKVGSNEIEAEKKEKKIKPKSTGFSFALVTQELGKPFYKAT